MCGPLHRAGTAARCSVPRHRLRHPAHPPATRHSSFQPRRARRPHASPTGGEPQCSRLSLRVTSCHFGVPSASGPHPPLFDVTKAGPCALPGGAADGVHHAHGDWIGYGTTDGSPVRRESVITTATSARSFRPSQEGWKPSPPHWSLRASREPYGFRNPVIGGMTPWVVARTCHPLAWCVPLPSARPRPGCRSLILTAAKPPTVSLEHGAVWVSSWLRRPPGVPVAYDTRYAMTFKSVYSGAAGGLRQDWCAAPERLLGAEDHSHHARPPREVVGCYP